MAEAYRDGFWFRKAVLEGCFTIPGDGCVDFLVEAEQDPSRADDFWSSSREGFSVSVFLSGRYQPAAASPSPSASSRVSFFAQCP